MKTIQTDDIQTYEPPPYCADCWEWCERCPSCRREIEMQDDYYSDRLDPYEVMEGPAYTYWFAVRAVERFQEEMARRGIVIATPAPSEEMLEFFDELNDPEADMYQPELVDHCFNGARPTVGTFSDPLQTRIEEWDRVVDGSAVHSSYEGPAAQAAAESETREEIKRLEEELEELAFWRRSAKTHQMMPPWDHEHEHDPELCWGCDRDLSACGLTDEDWHQGLHCHEAGHCPIQERIDAENHHDALAQEAMSRDLGWA